MTSLFNDNCLEKMLELPEKSVDLVLTDPPYGTTANKWDSVIDLKEMWLRLERVLKEDGVICLFSSQPFTSVLIASNLELYRYNWVWKKNGASQFLNAHYAPLKITEDICVFSKGTVGSLSKNKIRYYPQGLKKVDLKLKNDNASLRDKYGYAGGQNKIGDGSEYFQEFSGYPTNILEFKNDKCEFHPTQKPVKLLEYLIQTYTKAGETVLDFTMGSGSTGVACLRTDRNFIGIELDENYFSIAKKRIEDLERSFLF